ncbi:hypothetical protein Q3G72_019555 [Acer saccharum]|nr:hypothetical protein Q3G72_019555 [Acer saccharum]
MGGVLVCVNLPCRSLLRARIDYSSPAFPSFRSSDRLLHHQVILKIVFVLDRLLLRTNEAAKMYLLGLDNTPKNGSSDVISGL